MRGMNPVRGVLMLLAAVFAAWRGWEIHHGKYAWMAYALSVAALGLAVWHLTRKSDVRR
jgi:heme exporter protein D